MRRSVQETEQDKCTGKYDPGARMSIWIRNGQSQEEQAIGRESYAFAFQAQAGIGTYDL